MAPGSPVPNAVETEAAEAQLLLNQVVQEDRRADEARLSTEHEPDSETRAQRLAEAEAYGGRSTAIRENSRAAYDSAECRDGTAKSLESKDIDGRTVATRMRADESGEAGHRGRRRHRKDQGSDSPEGARPWCTGSTCGPRPLETTPTHAQGGAQVGGFLCAWGSGNPSSGFG